MIETLQNFHLSPNATLVSLHLLLWNNLQGHLNCYFVIYVLEKVLVREGGLCTSGDKATAAPRRAIGICPGEYDVRPNLPSPVQKTPCRELGVSHRTFSLRKKEVAEAASL
ncbi:unnamed protein product [Somion occarium]|uniref:Uncharacterized protein n=1 Tax=Somion occarium TaxID=3059160 RepID=A0ABP1CPZ2_9APHY